MNATRNRIAGAVAAALLGSTLYVAAVPAFGQGTNEPGRGGPRATQMTEADRAQMRERMRARTSQRLDRLAARLEIKASQQDAWGAYRKTIESTFGDRPQRPARDADAATLTRHRAEMAKLRAQRLTVMADATAKLQQALDPDQRKVLDEIARSMGQRGHRGHRGGHGRPEGHGGHHGGHGRV